MPLFIFLLLVILIAQVGFWDTLEAVLGGALMLVLLAVLVVLLAGVGVRMGLRRLGR
ncbi:MULTISPECIES: hypothetical protein [Rhodospirillales]|uniref:Uncharacterized protein n=2 Tax=Rhodospirillales TaxID=204441 RepID=B6IWB9_RHOCS|nr:hypothetical protein [Rhodospirillum centenum]ACJ00593.1 hypothetical protein RC1_3231 [Rhodospirillum centenum SW]